MSTHVFRVRPRERVFTGAATGLLLFIVFGNLLAHILPLSAAYWGASLLILAFGFVATRRLPPRRWFSVKDLEIGPLVLAFTGLLVLFTLINRGLAIFDDYFNLPLVSMMAAGDVPPHFYLNPDQLIDYHYGMHLFVASLIRIGGFFPWSAFDISKAFSLALTLILAWLWFRRLFRAHAACFWGVLLILFGGGTRWLLLLVPETSLVELGARLNLLGSALATGPDLYSMIAMPWKVEGGGPFPFPIAFANGIFPPLSFGMMRGISALPEMTLILLLLQARRKWRPIQGLVYGLLVTSLGLTGEHLFVMVWFGILLTILIGGWARRSISRPLQWGWTLLPGVILAPIMGGVLTHATRSSLAKLTDQPSATGIGLPNIIFRWPPAFISSHLGVLSLADNRQVLLALVEMGPVLLLAPWVIWLIRKRVQSGKWIMAGLGIGALIGFTSTLFIHFAARERDLSRLTGSALFIWMLLGFPHMWFAFRRGNSFSRFLLGAGYAMMILSGLALFTPQLIAISRAQLSFFVEESDALMSKVHWDQLDEGAWILDPAYPFRPPTLFGRSTGPAYQDVYRQLPEFQALRTRLEPIQIANSGYSYVYIDRETWREMLPEQRQTFQKACVKIIAEQKDEMGDFRRLLDVRACQKTP